MNEVEWIKFMADNVIRNDFLDNVDDIYVDLKEDVEK